MAGKGQADQRGDEDQCCLQADWSSQAADPVTRLRKVGLLLMRVLNIH